MRVSIPVLIPGLVLGAITALAACTQNAKQSAPEPVSQLPVVAPLPEPLVSAPQTSPPSPPVVREELEIKRELADAASGVELRAKSSMSRPASIGFAPPMSMPVPQMENREQYASLDANPLRRASEHPVSTFSVDVDTGSYANVRRYLNNGQLPPQDAVRVEELINNFDYAYSAPRNRDTPFAVQTEIAPTPWNSRTHLLHVGIQGWKPETRSAGTNLVFLVDVSGSMQDADKLPLVKAALKILVDEMDARDRISLVVYAGASGVVLEPTSAKERDRIFAALDRLEAGGSTNGDAGIQLAYAMAKQGWIEGGVNRVLLATDGDFNVGVTRFETLLDLVKEQRKSGIALTTLGFGEGNYNDHLMEQLADVGDGNHAYIDSVHEAHKVLVRQREATLHTIARDVKIQIEFNPALVAEYRLIGYENRVLAREDFANDAVDAGDIGAGHSVTALYEIALVGSGGEKIEPLRYGNERAAPQATGEIAHLRLRYKRPQDGVNASSRLIETALSRSAVLGSITQASPALRLSAAVAAFGQLLSGGVHMQGFDYTAAERLAQSAGDDPYGDRAGFRQLVKLAGVLSQQARVQGADSGG